MDRRLYPGEAFDLGDWITSLRYREIHALIWGFGLSAGAVVGYAIDAAIGSTVAGAALLVLAWAFTGRAAWVRDVERRVEHLDPTNRRCPMYVIGPSKPILHQVVREPHYYVGGLVAGVAAGTGLVTMLVPALH